MSEEKAGFHKKHEWALMEAFIQAGSNARVSEGIERIRIRARSFRALGLEPMGSAVARLNLEFKLTEWSTKIRWAIEDMDYRLAKHLSEAMGFKFGECQTGSARRRVGKEQLDDALMENDSFADTLLWACDWTVQEVWESKTPVDKAVRRLVRGVAAEWRWVTDADLPDVGEKDELWRPQGETRASHPLWVALDAAGVCVDWGAVRVLTNYARGKYPSAGGGVGPWTLDNNVFTKAPH